MDPAQLASVIEHARFRHLEKRPDGSYLLTYWAADYTMAHDLEGDLASVIARAREGLGLTAG